MQSDELEATRRWDIHTERMVAVAKTGIGAVTLLNSGSWIALLSQAGVLVDANTDQEALKLALLYWGMGAFCGTLCWLFVYWSASAQYRHDTDRENVWHRAELRTSFWLGLMTVVMALVLFLSGVLALGDVLT